MKTTILIIIIIFYCESLCSQNVNNTLGTGGIFSIKDNTNTLFSVNQSNGTINLVIPFGSNQRSSILKGGDRFLHTYFGSGTDGNNTFLGVNSGNFTLGGFGTQGSYNTGIGSYSLYSLTTGRFNSALGTYSLYSNTSGSQNSSFGHQSLYSNTTGTENSAFGYQSLYTNLNGMGNSAFGFQSLFSNTTGTGNSAFGFQSLYSNTTGVRNSAFGTLSLKDNTTGYDNSAFGVFSLTRNIQGWDNSAFGRSSMTQNTYGMGNSAFGNQTLFANTTGSFNCAYGYSALISNTTGSFNSALGNSALENNTTGQYNCALGYFSGTNITTGSNNIVINGANVPSGTANNQIRVGADTLTLAFIGVPWTITSDKNIKTNILNSNLGLGFIKKLNPVSYTKKNDKSQRIEYGLIAQEVLEVLKSESVENTGMITITDNGVYELRYNDLIAPLVKAIQELKDNYNKKKLIINELREEREKYYKEINETEILLSEIEGLKEKALFLEILKKNLN